MPQLDTVFSQLAVTERRGASGGRSTAPKSASALQHTTSGTARDSQPPATHTLLALFSRLCTPTRRHPAFNSDLQQVKSLLYQKEYLAAFGTDTEEGERWRSVYVARWTPARAVMYERILQECGVAEALGWVESSSIRAQSEEEQLERERAEARRRRLARQQGQTVAAVDTGGEEPGADSPSVGTPQNDTSEVVDVIMIGAGAGSEVVALGGVLGEATASAVTDIVGGPDSAKPQRRPRIAVHAADQGSWGTLLGKMEDELRQEWPALEASEAIGGGFSVSFVRGDILESPRTTDNTKETASELQPSAEQQAMSLPFSSPSLRLITICFTITELLLQSRLSTLRLLSSISHSSPRGCLLLIVESASLALIPLGKEGRTYPLGTLLDHALCGAQGDGAWEALKSEDAKWYRMPEGADEIYNAGGQGALVKLENSRVVIRLYRKK